MNDSQAGHKTKYGISFTGWIDAKEFLTKIGLINFFHVNFIAVLLTNIQATEKTCGSIDPLTSVPDWLIPNLNDYV
jgi:hypothetical protein